MCVCVHVHTPAPFYYSSGCSETRCSSLLFSSGNGLSYLSGPLGETTGPALTISPLLIQVSSICNAAPEDKLSFSTSLPKELVCNLRYDLKRYEYEERLSVL